MGIKDVGIGSHRYNMNKVRMTYIPPAIQAQLYQYCIDNNLKLPAVGLIKLAEHYSLGSAKYPDAESTNGFTFPNWAKGQLFDGMLMNSILRHAYAYAAGEKVDPDFGSHHLTAVAWGLSCLHHQFSNYALYHNFDDRMWKGFYTFDVEEDNLISVLMYIQTSINIDYTLYLLTKQLYLTLVIIENDSDKEINFTIDNERLEKIKNKDYGKPVSTS